MKRALLLLVAASACNNYAGPPCADVAFGELTVDVSSGSPVFSWPGSSPNDLFVVDGDKVMEIGDYWGDAGPHVWAVSCECKGNIDHPGENIGCRDSVDREYRACIDSAVTYGTPPTVENATEPTSPQALVSGRTYTVGVATYCLGERRHDPSVNGGDPYHENQVRAAAAFVAP